MLDLNRHIDCPSWKSSSKVSFDHNQNQWQGLEYACLKILQTYHKIFEEQEISDLIVRYDDA